MRIEALIVAALLAASSLLFGTDAQAEPRTVAVTTIIQHPALDAVRRGLREALREAGYVPGENLELLFESASGSPAEAGAIAERFVARRPDVIVPISTPSAQAVVRATSEIPVVFAAVTDPVAAHLVDDPARPGGNVTGVTDMTPIGRHLDLIREMLPEIATLGVVFAPDEANSLTLVELIKEEAPIRGIQIKEMAAPRLGPQPGPTARPVGDGKVILEAAAWRTLRVRAAVENDAGEVDALYVPTDNTVVAALETVIEVAAKHGLPVFAGDIYSVPRGAVAALGFNYYDLGRQAGRLVARILDGEAPGAIPVEGVATTELFLNAAAAESVGLALPATIVERARLVIR